MNNNTPLGKNPWQFSSIVRNGLTAFKNAVKNNVMSGDALSNYVIDTAQAGLNAFFDSVSNAGEGDNLNIAAGGLGAFYNKVIEDSNAGGNTSDNVDIGGINNNNGGGNKGGNDYIVKIDLDIMRMPAWEKHNPPIKPSLDLLFNKQNGYLDMESAEVYSKDTEGRSMDSIIFQKRDDSNEWVVGYLISNDDNTGIYNKIGFFLQGEVQGEVQPDLERKFFEVPLTTFIEYMWDNYINPQPEDENTEWNREYLTINEDDSLTGLVHLKCVTQTFITIPKDMCLRVAETYILARLMQCAQIKVSVHTCPAMATWGCDNNTCVQDNSGEFISRKECEDSDMCMPKQKTYKCDSKHPYECIEAPNGVTGPYTNMNDCKNICQISYDCIGNQCKQQPPRVGNYNSYDSCKNACKSPLPSWDCNGSPNYQCVLRSDGNGKFKKKVDCVNDCIAPPYTPSPPPPDPTVTWDCMNIVDAADGSSYKGCRKAEDEHIGKYTSFNDCNKECKPPVIPTCEDDRWNAGYEYVDELDCVDRYICIREGGFLNKIGNDMKQHMNKDQQVDLDDTAYLKFIQKTFYNYDDEDITFVGPTHKAGFKQMLTSGSSIDNVPVEGNDSILKYYDVKKHDDLPLAHMHYDPLTNKKNHMFDKPHHSMMNNFFSGKQNLL